MPTPPVLEARALGHLGEQLGDPAVLCDFVCRYTQMLPGRVERVRLAVLARDIEALHDAGLSLKTSSQMVGAIALSGKIAELLIDVELTPPDESGWSRKDHLLCLCSELDQLAGETADDLRVFLAGLTLESRLTQPFPLPA